MAWSSLVTEGLVGGEEDFRVNIEFAVAVMEPGCDKSMNESFCKRR